MIPTPTTPIAFIVHDRHRIAVNHVMHMVVHLGHLCASRLFLCFQLSAYLAGIIRVDDTALSRWANWPASNMIACVDDGNVYEFNDHFLPPPVLPAPCSVLSVHPACTTRTQPAPGR